ncbi:MAG: imidazole glycerol phosphate synthase subunit HisH [Anaerolineae bacterium]|uniref:imidazole glycerol phosphate synthase subunit HisH n=1 Tax=Thermoflexus sp. TaxID=1969742 RepID=UPI0025D46305|nr:imidazole glycerol phosphate synthase subunit HisH [Thermoflexus sp.]MCS7351968.1 imidazole glycerol phosphate synthase subunit HisH [Thermoflexus sp.]MDW8181427.1 imidazole glycerol phosphate synthase subunit HisH [Anaerolineae bacterium]
MTRVLVIDYGIGNLGNVVRAFRRLGAEVRLQEQPEDLEWAEKIVLPGVGAFGDGMAGLAARGWIEPLKRAVVAGIPLLGICLGMQLLFEESEEMGRHPGLGLLRGRVRRFPPEAGKVPQIGWNRLEHTGSHPLLHGVPDRAYVYFVHGYYCEPEDPADGIATTVYGIRYASMVARGPVMGVQFHPEKSHRVGEQILRNFLSL